MGFLKPDMPVVDFAEWIKGSRSEKIRPMARHWAEVGFGTPVVMHLFYVVKILLYILGGWLFALATTGRRRFHRRRAVVDRTDRLREGRALHDAVRGRGTWLRLRTVEQPVLPAAGIDPRPVAAQHHSAATVARPGAADEGHRPVTDRRGALRRAACGASHRLVLRRDGADPRTRHRDRCAADVADLVDSRAARGGWVCATR